MKPLVLIITLVLAVCLLCAGCTTTPESTVTYETTESEMLSILGDLQGGVTESLNEIDRAASTTARKLGKTGLSGPEAEVLLDDVLTSEPSAYSAITVAQNGTVIATRPAIEGLVGRNLSYQTVVQEIFNRKVPVMSDLFLLAEGGHAVTIEYPVFSPEEEVIGMMSVAFMPDSLIKKHAEPAVRGTDYSVMVAQPGGLVLYDADPEEIGKETFNESMYKDFPELLEFAGEFSGKRTGNATYSFYDKGFKEVVQKEACWTTVGIHGAEWRLILMHPLL